MKFDEHIYQEGKVSPLLSSELHYFRIPKEHWEHVVDATIEMGNEYIAFYVPWFVHEHTEGVFDFTGETSHTCDLISWLSLLARKNVKVILRPGPYIYAEMQNLGIPQWLVDKHPEARIMEMRGEELCYSEHGFAFAHNNPVFLGYVKRWLKEVIQVCRPYIGEDNMITMIQLCNEIPGVDIDDHNPMTLQLQNPDSLFFQFYKDRYQSIEQLNESYHTTYTSFTQVRPWDLKKEKKRYEIDHLSYYYEYYYVAYFKALKAVYEEEGIVDVPFLHNAYNPRAISLHLQIRKQLPDLYYGIDNYFSLRSIFDERSASYYCEFAPGFAKAAFHHAPFVLEHESGYWLDSPKVYGKDLYLFTIWSYLGGFKGSNLYLGHEGKNQPGMGMLATTHEWQAPIRMDGTKKDSFYDIKAAYEYIKSHPAILEGETIYDMAYAFPFRPGLIWESISEQSEQLFYYLYQCQLHAEIVDFDHEQTKHDVMMYVSDERMDEEVQQKLVSYVAEGNTLILCGIPPKYDQRLQPCRVVLDAFGIDDIVEETYDCWGQKLILETGEEVLQDAYPIPHIKLTQEHRCMAKDQKGREVLLKLPYGKGVCYVFLGAIRYLMKSQRMVMDLIWNDRSKQKQYQSDTFRVIQKQYQDQRYTYILNPNPFPMEECILLQGEPQTIQLDAYEVEEYSYEKKRNLE